MAGPLEGANMGNKGNDITIEGSDNGSYAHKLYLSDFLRESIISSAIRSLKLPYGSRGLDAGCGSGSHTMLLAKAVGSDGHVVGLDLSPAFLTQARGTARQSGLSERVSFQEGNLSNLVFDDDTFDWVWSVDCIGYHHSEPQILKEIARVAKPGGIIAILVWSSQQLLPGYPLLEARLNATSSGIAPFTKGTKPELHPLRGLGCLHEAGLEEISAQTFVGDVQAPLTDDIRSALVSLFEMRWGEPQSELSVEDWAEYRRLCQPESSDFILNLPDYYAFFTYSLFQGKVS